MSSTISAGTTSGTAISFSGDTSGQLVLQTNGTTTAVTISTGQVVTLAQPLPVASGGSGVTTSTGTGAVVLGTSPTLATPTFDSAQLATVTGTAPLYMCRAWVNFNGQGTVAIRASGNVSSITDSGVGTYIVNFTTAMPDANYVVAANATLSYSLLNIFSPGINTGSTGNAVAPTTSACSMYIATSNTATFDPDYVNVSIFR